MKEAICNMKSLADKLVLTPEAEERYWEELETTDEDQLITDIWNSLFA